MKKGRNRARLYGAADKRKDVGEIEYVPQEHIPVSPLIEAPRVLIKPSVELEIWDVVANSPGEIGWLGSVKVNGRDLLIDQIFSFEQEVTDSFNSLNSESLRLFWRKMALSGRDSLLNRMMFWGHSHGTHKSIPSAIDRATMHDLFGGQGFPYIIMGIFNRHRDAWFSVYDYNHSIVFDDVKLTRDTQPPDELILEVRKEMGLSEAE